MSVVEAPEEVQSGDVAERHGGADGCAGSGVGAARPQRGTSAGPAPKDLS
jgi:hypothetical protein